MAFSAEIEAFIKLFVKDLLERNVAIFAGAGLSVASGYVNWPELLREIADELGLSVDKEKDLISLAQFHVNENAGRGTLNRKILDEFTEDAVESENHRILARLPITTYWTTNYDRLIEKALESAGKRADVKHEVDQLATTKPKRDAVVYKMHGDVDHPAGAILTKQDYQSYYKDHEAFITALSGDLVSKTFLFIGFSFSDPNLEYVLGRLSIQFGINSRPHFTFIKRLNRNDYKDDDSFEYERRLQNLQINDLKRYKIKALVVDNYSDITKILQEVSDRFRKKTVFISGSAEEYGRWDRTDAQKLIHTLSGEIIRGEYSIVNGFGWGVGSAVINGALEAITRQPQKYSQDQLLLWPFPQFETGEKKLPDLWEEYRQRIISTAGIAVFIFGNKADGKGGIMNANGVRREFEIAIAHGLVPIAIGATEYEAREIYEEIMKEPGKYYGGLDWIVDEVKHLAEAAISTDEIVTTVIRILGKLQE